MFFREARPFVKELIEELAKNLEQAGVSGLSRIQRGWLSFCVMGIIVTNSVCWARFERASLCDYTIDALSWMLHHAPIPWNWMLQMGVRVILRRYGIREGVALVDDTDRQRSKRTKRLHRTYKVYDKKTGGYFNGQTIVFLVLVTETLTLPVGFAFYQPDPVLEAWEKEEKRLKAQKVPKWDRPPKPKRTPNYPTKPQLALDLLQTFLRFHPEIKLNAWDGDNLYASGEMMDEVAELVGGQAISQMKTNQKVRYKGQQMSVSTYFCRHPPVKQKLRIRGGKEEEVWIGSARLFVPSHGKKRFVIALKYEGEEEYRYLIATDLTWRTIDIVECYTLRWLVEVFIEDFKEYEGWGQLAKQQGEEGSSRGLILSLLCDLSLLLHPSQQACFENKQPAFTVGSLLRKARAETLVDFIQPLIANQESQEKLEEFGRNIEKCFELTPSKKHMSGRKIGRLEPTPSLKYRAEPEETVEAEAA